MAGNLEGIIIEDATAQVRNLHERGAFGNAQTRFVYVDTNTNTMFVFVSSFGSEITDTETNTIEQ